MIALQTSDRNGVTVAALQVMAGQEIMLISSTGTLVRTTVDEISVLGRNTQGVRLIRLGEGERLVGIERVESLEGAARTRSAGEVPTAATARRGQSAQSRRAAGRGADRPPELKPERCSCAYSISPRGRPRCPWKSSNRPATS